MLNGRDGGRQEKGEKERGGRQAFLRRQRDEGLYGGKEIGRRV